MKHGLSSNALAPRICEAKVDRLIKAIIGNRTTSDDHKAARNFALAELAWQRVQRVQRTLLQNHCKDALVSDPKLAAINRYERRAANKRLRALCALDFPLPAHGDD
jgi:hypothetical protein